MKRIQDWVSAPPIQFSTSRLLVRLLIVSLLLGILRHLPVHATAVESYTTPLTTSPNSRIAQYDALTEVARAAGTEVSPAAHPVDSSATCPRNGGYRFLHNGYCLILAERVVEQNGRLLAPLRSVLNAVGGSSVDVLWYQEWRTACGATPTNMVCFPIDENSILFDGEIFGVNQGAKILPPTRGRTGSPSATCWRSSALALNTLRAIRQSTSILTTPHFHRGRFAGVARCTAMTTT